MSDLIRLRHIYLDSRLLVRHLPHFDMLAVRNCLHVCFTEEIITNYDDMLNLATARVLYDV